VLLRCAPPSQSPPTFEIIIEVTRLWRTLLKKLFNLAARLGNAAMQKHELIIVAAQYIA
jgi:hypothetical protein